MAEHRHDKADAPPSPPSPAPPVTTAPADLRRIVFYSLLTGLCPLIPLPFLDDWVRDVLRRRLAVELAGEHGLELTDGEVRILATGDHPATLGGCLRGCVKAAVVGLVKVILKIVRKLYREILFFLTVRQCVITFSRTFHEAYLARHALAVGALAPSPPPVAQVRRAIEAAIAEPDQRPILELVRRTLSGSWRLLRRSARQLGRLFRTLRRSGREKQDLARADLNLEEEEQALGGLVDELTEEIGQETGYLRQLEALLEKHLAAPGPD